MQDIQSEIQTPRAKIEIEGIHQIYDLISYVIRTMVANQTYPYFMPIEDIYIYAAKYFPHLNDTEIDEAIINLFNFGLIDKIIYMDEEHYTLRTLSNRNGKN